jgi:type I restriction enzyme M protein
MYGAVQPEVAPYYLKNILIPQFSNSFQQLIESLVIKSNKIIEKSKQLYQQAEELLLTELGLKDWQPTEDNITVKSFSQSFLASGRLDAEYYQPKYDQLISKINNYNYLQLIDIVTIKKSIEPGSDVYSDQGIPFIRVSNLSQYGLSETEIYLPENLIENIHTLKPKKDTILLSKDGSIGIAYKVDQDLDIITSSAILHLTIKNNLLILPDYLTLVLNSIITKLQAERDSGGSIIQHWRISEIEQILIPVIDLSLQENISNKMQESFNLRQQSKQLLEIAKIGVEKAIESDEDIAINWINEELGKWEIEI